MKINKRNIFSWVLSISLFCAIANVILSESNFDMSVDLKSLLLTITFFVAILGSVSSIIFFITNKASS